MTESTVAGTSSRPAVPASGDADVIKQQIERTREGMSETINELQQRLSPQHLADQAKASVREATVGRMQHFMGAAGDTATHVAGRAQEAAGVTVEQVREHPIPVALAGAGAGLVWWLMHRASSRQTWSNDMYDWDDADVTYDRDYARLEVRGDDDWGARSWDDRGGGLMRMLRDNPIPASIAAATIGYMLWNRRGDGSIGDTFPGRSSLYGADGYDAAFETSSSTRSSMAANVGDTAREMSKHARDAASAIGEQVGDSMRSAQARAGTMSRDMSRRMRRAGHRTTSQLDRWMHENPMAVGIAALAAGAVVGLSAPGTHTENQVMGSSRDALWEKASEEAQHLKAQVRDKVQAVADAAGMSSTSGAAPESTTADRQDSMP